MKHLLAVTFFLAGAMFPFALKSQSVRQFSKSARLIGWRKAFQSSEFRFFHPLNEVPRSVVFPPFLGYPPNYPFEYFYPGLWPPLDDEYQQASQIAHGDVGAEVADQEKALYSSQIQVLTDEVQSLRQQESVRLSEQAPASPPRSELLPRSSGQAESAAEETFPSTVFVYRDGRRLDARNYAIFGQTLWVFHGETTHKFPLADFDLAASRQVNEERGVEFPLSDGR
jgi:hypothetical protein